MEFKNTCVATLPRATKKKKEASQTINERMKDDKISTPRHLLAISKENNQNARKKLLLCFLGEETDRYISLSQHYKKKHSPERKKNASSPSVPLSFK